MNALRGGNIVKNVKLFLILITVLIVIMFCTVRFILIPNKNTNNRVTEENSEDKVPKDVLSSNPDSNIEPKLILDADELTNLTIDYNSKIPVEAIINNSAGYKKYYKEMIQSVELISKEDKNYPFYHSKGYYMSKVPIYHFDAKENTISSEVQVILFSKDLEKQAGLILFLNNHNKIIINGMFPISNIEVLKKSPNERYIFLYNRNELILDSNNKLMNGGRFPIEVKGDYYHALDYDTLGVSYTILTDASNLVWIDLNNKKFII